MNETNVAAMPDPLAQGGGTGAQLVGRVLRSSTAGFTVGCQMGEDDFIPPFGALIRGRAGLNGSRIYGLVYNILIDDDPFVRQLIAADNLTDEIIADQRQRRQVPVEVSALVVGYQDGDQVRYTYPPRPPLTLNRVYVCSDEEVVRFSRSYDYFRIILDAPQVPGDALLPAHLRNVAALLPDPQLAHNYRVEAGRELARLLNNDPQRLDAILRRLN